jgi:hypothetical protein
LEIGKNITVEDFIKKGIARANKELAKLPVIKYTDVKWYLDTEYEEGLNAYILGYSESKDQFFYLLLDPDPDIGNDPYTIYGYVEGDWLTGLEW